MLCIDNSNQFENIDNKNNVKNNNFVDLNVNIRQNYFIIAMSDGKTLLKKMNKINV